MHPIRDFSDLSDQELEKKLVKLNGTYFMTDSDYVRQQMILLIDSMKLELDDRRRRNANKTKPEEPDSPLDNLINVS
jgi:hypothetical protein